MSNERPLVDVVVFYIPLYIKSNYLYVKLLDYNKEGVIHLPNYDGKWKYNPQTKTQVKHNLQVERKIHKRIDSECVGQAYVILYHDNILVRLSSM